jgi:hypothetical protein
MPQVNAKLSESTFTLLKHLAHQQQATYAVIIERALLAYEPGASHGAIHGASDIQALIESALAPVLERLEMLESLGLVKHQHLSGVTVHVTPQDAPEPALDAQAIPEPQSDEESPKIAVSAAVDVIEGEAAEASSSILPDSGPAKRSVKAFIADLVAAGERSPTKLAQALNDSGYRTGTGSEFKRSNPQIAAALKAKD